MVFLYNAKVNNIKGYKMQNIVHVKNNDLNVSIQDMADFSKNNYKSDND